MTGLLVTAVLTLALAAGLVPLVLRDLRRAVARRRARRLRWSGEWVIAAHVAAGMVPSMREAVRAAAEFEEAMARVQAMFGSEAVRRWIDRKGEDR